MGRKTQGAGVADRVEGSDLAKQRLKAILQTLTGEKSVAAVCEDLQIGEAMFFRMRERFLAESVELLEPRRPGPKPAEESPEEQKYRLTEERNRELTFELEIARMQTEIALVVPHLLNRQLKKKAALPHKGRPPRDRAAPLDM